MLVAAGARVNVHDRSGAHAVLICARLGHAECLAALVLSRDAPVRALDQVGQAVELVDAYPLRGDAARAFINVGSVSADEVASPVQVPVTPLLEAVSQRHTASVLVLLAAGADVERADVNGRTPLIAAAGAGFEEILRPLLRLGGAKVNARDVSGGTALFHAV